MPTTTVDSPGPDRRELLVTGLLGLVVAAIAVGAFFGPGILGGSELFFTNDIGASDFWHLNYPFRRVLANQLADGQLPLWSTKIGTGFPLLAEGQTSALYPPNQLLYSLLPFPAALNWEILFHLVLAGGFAAAYARQRGAGRGGSATAGLVFALSGFLLVHLKHTNMITAAAWLPLLFLCIERYAIGRRPMSLVLLALTVGAMCIGGHPQVVYNNLFMAGLVALALLPGVYLRKRRAADVARVGGALLGAVGIGILLSAPQLLPTWELKQLGPRREGLSLDDSTRIGYAPRHLLLFLSPKAFGDPANLERVPVIDPTTGTAVVDPATGAPWTRPAGFDDGRAEPGLFWENTAYVGLLPLALAILAIFVARRRALPLLLLVLVGLLFSLGKYGGLYPICHGTIPGFDLFRFPGRFLLYVALGLSVLAGIGLTGLLDRLRAVRLRPALVVAVLAVCFLDLTIAFGDHNRRVEAARWLAPPPSVRQIRAAESAGGPPFRVLTLDPERRRFQDAYYCALGWQGDLSPYETAWNLVHPNLGALWDLDCPLVHSPSVVSWEEEATLLLFGMDPNRPGSAILNPAIAALLNVRYLIVPRPPGSGGAYRVAVERNPRALPRAFLVPRMRPVPNGAPEDGGLSYAMAALLDRSFDPTREILISDAPPTLAHGAAGPAPAIDRPVEILEYSSRRVRVRFDAPADCWLFLGDLYYPGWSATLDGGEVPIRRANSFGRGVPVPAGRHEVEFRYRCAPLVTGAWLSLLALLALVTFLLFHRLSARRRAA